MPKQSHNLERLVSFRIWVFVSILVALIEIIVTSVTSDAFRQYLRDLPFVWVYWNFLGVVVVYGFSGGVGWLFLWVLSRIKGEKGEYLFIKNGEAICGMSIIFIYGFWFLRKFLFLHGILHSFSLLLASGGMAAFSGFLAWRFQRHISSQAKRMGAGAILLVSFTLPLLFRASLHFYQSAFQTLPNVILLTVDTLRLDHLGWMGYPNAKTPHINRLASQGLVFRNAYAQIPLTAPSFSSILTGLYPKTHGCRANLMRLDSSVTTLAEVFSEAGYETAAFVSGYPLKRELSGLSQGFRLYQDRFSFFDGFKLLRFLERWHVVELQFERRAHRVSPLAVSWMRRHAKDPFFVWVHYYDPHAPYRPPLPSSADPFLRDLSRHQRHLWGKTKAALPPGSGEAMSALYDGEIAFVDQDIGRILAFLERSGERTKTLIVFVSDHGEGFDHDYYFDHGDRLYESCIRIPVIFSYPGVVPENKTSERLIQSIDLFPTVLSLLKLPEHPCEGRNLFEKGIFLEDSTGSVYAELSRRPGYPTLGDLWSIREGPWKLIYSPEGKSPELYHLEEDPGETSDLSLKEPERVKKMTQALIQWMGKRKEVFQPQVEGLTREKLKSLGYLQ